MLNFDLGKINANFVLLNDLYYARENAPHLGRSLQNLHISQGYIFRILQHFPTKLCNVTIKF